jgi:hypothetical protein
MQTVDYVEKAKSETKAAVVYQKKARRVRVHSCFIFYAFLFWLTLSFPLI